MTVNTLFLQRADEALDHPNLLRAKGRDELMLQSIASNQPGMVTTVKKLPPDCTHSYPQVCSPS